MKVQMKLLSGATRPSKNYDHDAGYDLYTLEETCVNPNWRQKRTTNIRTGVHLALPNDIWGAILPRSSTIHRHHLQVVSAVVDPGFRGELFVQVISLSDDVIVVPKDTRLAQLVPHRVLQMDFEEVPELPQSDRGNYGFGSSGR